MMERAVKETLDFIAHAGAAFLLLAIAFLLGAYFTPEAAIVLAWAMGLIREATEWQDGGNHPFTRWGLLDQAGWISGGVAFAWIVS